MRIKKTAFVWVIGTILIIGGIFWGNFGIFDYRFLFENPQYTYSANEIVKNCKVSGLKVSGQEFEAETEDAWFVVELHRRGVIKSVEVNLLSSNAEEPAQIYYSTRDEFLSDLYKDKTLFAGSNLIEFGGERNIKSLRFDITSKIGEKFEIDSITIREEYTKRLYFWIFTPVILIVFWIVSAGYINRCWIKRLISKNPIWLKKYNDIDQIMSLAISDFKARFSGSYLGIFWGILQPLSTILLFWFVFQVGFRSQPIEDVPFILWLAAGMIPWNYFYDSWFGGTAAFTGYSYIVKKVVFKVEMLPLVKVLSASLLTLIFNIILILIYALYGYFPGFHIFDMLYFSFCFAILTLGLSYITATLNVFIKDIGQFLGIALQFLMWMTPMMWVYTTIPESMSWFYKLNPLHYVINGYRESLINGHWFYYQWKEMIWFWVVAGCCLFIGKKLMKRLRPHFADVL